MARGNGILVDCDEYRGKRWEYVVASGETHTPGVIVQIQAATALQGGKFTMELYNADADGGRPKGCFVVVTEDHYQGKTTSDTYSAGQRAFGYTPLPGDEINLLIADVTAGTGTGATADHTKGEVFIVDDTTGKMIATTGSPETEVAMLLETQNDLTADTLGWSVWSGY